MPATTVRKPAKASSGKTAGRTHSTHSEESRQDRHSLIWQDGQDVSYDTFAKRPDHSLPK